MHPFFYSTFIEYLLFIKHWGCQGVLDQVPLFKELSLIPKGSNYLLGVKDFWPFGNFSPLGQCFSNWIVYVNPPEILLKRKFCYSDCGEGA